MASLLLLSSTALRPHVCVCVHVRLCVCIEVAMHTHVFKMFLVSGALFLCSQAPWDIPSSCWHTFLQVLECTPSSFQAPRVCRASPVPGVHPWDSYLIPSWWVSVSSIPPSPASPYEESHLPTVLYFSGTHENCSYCHALLAAFVCPSSTTQHIPWQGGLRWGSEWHLPH